MKLKIFLIAILLSAQVFAQGIDQNFFINNLGNKETATFGDAVTIYIMTLGRTPMGFNADVNTLKGMKILKDKKYESKNPLRRGMLCYMIAQHLKLKDSLLYKIFKTERYAFRACVADGLMDFDTSEWDKLSGEELIEIMALVSDRMEDK